MAEEIREAVQIIEVAYDGIEIAMKIGSGGIAAMQKIDGKDTILRRMAQWEFSIEQQEEVGKAMSVGVPEEKILDYFYPDVDVGEMRQVREEYEKASA